MKRILLPLFIVSNIALMLFLFRPGAGSRKEGDPIVFEQRSQKAIFNMKDPEQIEIFLKHGLKVTSPHSNPQTIVKIVGHHGPVSNQKIESPGDVFIINPDGIVVGETATFDWAAPQGEAELEAPGNVYALAIKEDGKIRAVDLEAKSGTPTIFEYPKDDGKLLFSDE